MSRLFSRIWSDKSASEKPAPAAPKEQVAKPPPAMHVDVSFRIAVVGATGVGKSSLCRRYCQNSFTNQYQPTIGIESRMVRLASSHSRQRVPIILELVEIPQQERQGPHADTVLMTCDGAIIVLDATQNSSLPAVDDWMSLFTELREPRPLPVVLVANKVDKGELIVPLEALDCYSEELGVLRWETASAKQGTGVKAAMDSLVEALVKDLGMAPRGPEQLMRRRSTDHSIAPAPRAVCTTAACAARYPGLECTDASREPAEVCREMLAAVELALLQLSPQLADAKEELVLQAEKLRAEFEKEASRLAALVPTLHQSQAWAVLAQHATQWEAALIQLEVCVATSPGGTSQPQSTAAATYMLSSLALLFPAERAAAEPEAVEPAAAEAAAVAQVAVESGDPLDRAFEAEYARAEESTTSEQRGKARTVSFHVDLGEAQRAEEQKQFEAKLQAAIGELDRPNDPRVSELEDLAAL